MGKYEILDFQSPLEHQGLDLCSMGAQHPTVDLPDCLLTLGCRSGWYAQPLCIQDSTYFLIASAFWFGILDSQAS